MKTLTQRERKARQEQRDYGYALYMAMQDIKLCTNDEQRVGWRAARTGHLASITVDAMFAVGGNASDADYALAGMRL